MRSLYFTSLALAIIGSINWGLVGVLDYNLVASLFGINSIISKFIYSLVGASGIYLLLRMIGNITKKVS